MLVSGNLCVYGVPLHNEIFRGSGESTPELRPEWERSHDQTEAMTLAAIKSTSGNSRCPSFYFLAKTVGL